MNSNRFNVPVEEIEKQKEYMKLVRTVIDSRFHGKAPKAFVHTYGCQGNVSDGEKLQGMLFEMGYEFTNDVKKADLVLIETESVNMFPVYDAYSAIVYSANPSNVHSVWVNGVQTVENKRLVHHDLKQLKKELDKEMTEFRKLAAI